MKKDAGKPALSSAERQRRYRERKKAAHLTELRGLYVTDEHEIKIREFTKSLECEDASDMQESPSVKLTRDQYIKLVLLSRRALHTAYVWNEHNFQFSPEEKCKITVKELGIGNLDAASDFLASLPLIEE